MSGSSRLPGYSHLPDMMGGETVGCKKQAGAGVRRGQRILQSTSAGVRRGQRITKHQVRGYDEDSALQSASWRDAGNGKQDLHNWRGEGGGGGGPVARVRAQGRRKCIGERGRQGHTQGCASER
jgi:hypothetical protein